MEIISIKNNHKKVKEYGCVCPNCETSFIFNQNEINTHPDLIDYIRCPNEECGIDIDINVGKSCGCVTTFSRCHTKEDFIELNSGKLEK